VSNKYQDVTSMTDDVTPMFTQRQ